MPLIIRRTVAFVQAAMNERIRQEAINAISRVNYTDLFAAPGSLVNGNGLRIDMQGSFFANGQTFSNIQVQLNILRRPGQATTIAHVEVGQTSIGTEDPANQRGVEHRVQKALRISLANADTCRITGTVP